MSTTDVAGARVLLLIPAQTYRASDFLAAAHRMGLSVVVASGGALPLGGHPVLHADPRDPRRSAGRLVARAGPVDAVVAVDTRMLVLASAVAARMGLPRWPSAITLSRWTGNAAAGAGARSSAAAVRRTRRAPSPPPATT